MCVLPNIQAADLEELLKQRSRQTKKTNAETIEIFMPAKIQLSCK
jgi:hypothetical protein